MTCRTTNRRTRAAFTLVELLVTLTVLLIMMTILAVASSIAAETFRNAKVQGDFISHERAALAVLRRDLQYRHFADEDGKPNLGKSLSDQRLDQLGWYQDPAMPTRYLTTGYKPPRSGYFYAESTAVDGLSNWSEGFDDDGFESTRSGNHVLAFTIIVPGGAPENVLTADVPLGNPASSSSYPIGGRAGEVAYFLAASGKTPGNVTRYKLIRRQRLCAFNDDDKPAYQNILNSSGAAATDPPEVMAVTGAAPNFNVFNLNDLTVAANRVGGSPFTHAAITQHRIGEDVLLDNVTSFEVKFTGPRAAVSYNPGNGPPATEWPRPFYNPVTGTVLNTDYPYDTLPFDGKFDTFNAIQADWNDAKYVAGSPTGTALSPLKRLRITGVSVRLRCWNPKSRSSRQSTLTVDL